MKNEILHKAGCLYKKYGYKSVTMDDIAKEMSISKKTLYKYFSNKEMLVDETIKVLCSTCMQKITEIKNMGLLAIQETFEIKKEFKKTFNSVSESPMFQLRKYYPEVYQKMVQTEVGVFKTAIKENVIKGIKEGSYRADTNIDVSVDFYFSLIFGLHEKNISQDELLILEEQALVYHTRAIATLKGIGELELQLNKSK